MSFAGRPFLVCEQRPLGRLHLYSLIGVTSLSGLRCLSDAARLAASKNSASFTAGNHYMLHTLDCLHVLRPFEG